MRADGAATRRPVQRPGEDGWWLQNMNENKIYNQGVIPTWNTTWDMEVMKRRRGGHVATGGNQYKCQLNLVQS